MRVVPRSEIERIEAELEIYQAEVTVIILTPKSRRRPEPSGRGRLL